jgi:hypothetical protein
MSQQLTPNTAKDILYKTPDKKNGQALPCEWRNFIGAFHRRYKENGHPEYKTMVGHHKTF